jgi:hypothetical protein
MFFRFCVFSSFLFLFILSVAESKTANHSFSASKEPSNPISVRESNTELQISVGKSIYVFGKAKGTLDKVKVGMHVLPFSQVAGTEGNQNTTFSKVTWKRLKSGSIQIQSSYYPWPGMLTWTVFPNGELKMETASQSGFNFKDGWIGLGFNYPDLLLNQISWKNTGNHAEVNHSVWKNTSFTPMADPELEIISDDHGFFQPVHQVKLEFETITLSIRSETPGLHLGFGKFADDTNAFPHITADLAFLLNHSVPNSNTISQSPSGPSASEQTISLNPLVLWFHFQ